MILSWLTPLCLFFSKSDYWIHHQYQHDHCKFFGRKRVSLLLSPLHLLTVELFLMMDLDFYFFHKSRGIWLHWLLQGWSWTGYGPVGFQKCFHSPVPWVLHIQRISFCWNAICKALFLWLFFWQVWGRSWWLQWSMQCIFRGVWYDVWGLLAQQCVLNRCVKFHFLTTNHN